MSDVKIYDAIVLGGGPGGYPAAIRLGQLKLKTLVIEKEWWGGVCLNWGCIPSKALIAAANQVEKLHHADVMGISTGPVTVDANKLMAWKDGIVNNLTRGVKGLCGQNGGETVTGYGTFVDRDTIEVTTNDGNKRLVKATKGIIVATGATPIELPGFKFDGKRIISAKEGVSLNPIPKHLVIIGGGVIGMELGGVYSKLGAKVTIVEYLPSVLASMDPDLVDPPVKAMKKQGVEFLTGTAAKGAEVTADGVRVTVDTAGKVQTIDADVVMVAVGFRPNSAGFGLDKLGVALDKRGHIIVNERCETNVKGIYAVGDVSGIPYLAHKATKEGEIAAEVLAGKKSAKDWLAMPAATYTHPEIASVGIMEKEAKEKGLDIVVGKFPFSFLARAMAVSETEGFVKVIAQRTGKNKKDYRIVGVHIVGPAATDLISEAALAIEMEAFAEDIGLTVHPHPTLSEALMEAAKHALGEAIHIRNTNPPVHGADH